MRQLSIQAPFEHSFVLLVTCNGRFYAFALKLEVNDRRNKPTPQSLLRRCWFSPEPFLLGSATYLVTSFSLEMWEHEQERSPHCRVWLLEGKRCCPFGASLHHCQRCQIRYARYCKVAGENYCSTLYGDGNTYVTLDEN